MGAATDTCVDDVQGSTDHDGNGELDLARARHPHARSPIVEAWLIERPISGSSTAVDPPPASATTPVRQSSPRPSAPSVLAARGASAAAHRPVRALEPEWRVRALEPEWAVVVRPPTVGRSPSRAVVGQPVPIDRRRRPLRRALAGVVLLAAVVLGVAALSAVGGDGPPSDRSDRPAPVASVAYVVRAGDTLWSIAREIQPEGDVRPLVDVLSAQRHGEPLEPGDVVAWPPLPGSR